MFDHLKNIFIDYSLLNPGEESCGLVIRANRTLSFYPTKNIHDDPVNEFAIAAEDYAIASSKGEVAAIFHSHNNGNPEFSEADRIACEASGLPWILLALPQQQMTTMHPSGYVAPLVGREFCYGITDCYTIIRDAFKEIDIILRDYPRKKLYEWKNNPDWNLYEENFKNEGFIEIDKYRELKKYDLLLMQIDSTKINHAGLIWEPDKNIFIHHLIDRYSELSVYGGYWQEATIKIARHKNLWQN